MNEQDSHRVAIEFPVAPLGRGDDDEDGVQDQTIVKEYEELLQDLDDLAVIARRKKEPTIPLAEIKRVCV